MTATNHALTGALIGLIVGNPLVAVPLAIVSHFVCDSLPHFGLPKSVSIGSSKFLKILIVDASLCVGLVLILALLRPAHWQLAAVTAFLATSPDLMSIPRFLRARANKKEKKLTGIHHFHKVIQWFERPIGITVEAAWALSAVILLKVLTV